MIASQCLYPLLCLYPTVWDENRKFFINKWMCVVIIVTLWWILPCRFKKNHLVSRSKRPIMTTGRGTGPIDNRSRNKRRNLWVGRCVSSWWPWFPSRSSVLIYMYIYEYVHSLYEFCYRSYIQWECHSVLAKLQPITFNRGVRGSWSQCHFVFSLVYQLCLALWQKSNTRMLVTFDICLKQYFDTRYLVFYNTSPPRMFLSLDLLWEYRVQHGANGPLYVTSS